MINDDSGAGFGMFNNSFGFDNMNRMNSINGDNSNWNIDLGSVGSFQVCHSCSQLSFKNGKCQNVSCVKNHQARMVSQHSPSHLQSQTNTNHNNNNNNNKNKHNTSNQGLSSAPMACQAAQAAQVSQTIQIVQPIQAVQATPAVQPRPMVQAAQQPQTQARNGSDRVDANSVGKRFSAIILAVVFLILLFDVLFFVFFLFFFLCCVCVSSSVV